MNQNIKVTSDRENEVRTKLNELGWEKENKAKLDYNLSQAIYEELFFAPIANNMLGTFYPDGKYIVLNEDLLELNINQRDVENIFLHELSHALDFAINKSLSGHSTKFREYCDYFGVDKGFEKAKVKATLKGKQGIDDKIKKLLALSESPFENEAMIALTKAQKLMLDTSKEKGENEKLYITELYENGRIALYISKIASFVAKLTGVFIVKCREDKLFVLRAYGSFEEVEFSLYLFDYLNQSFERAIKKLRKKGEHISKDAFISGAISELEARLSLWSNAKSNEIIVIQNENRQKAKRLVFQKGLRTIKYSSRKISKDNYSKGASFARKLDVPLAVKQRKLT